MFDGAYAIEVDDGYAQTLYGPFDNDDSAREWAHENLDPSENWYMRDIEPITSI